jgi:hypothetical protein
MTVLPVQSADKAYTAMGDLWLEVPKLGVQMNIVGVPETAGTWDVSWLGKQAGWLQGSAFPTWTGNSVLTGHVWNADNTVGPFRYINTLWWGGQSDRPRLGSEICIRSSQCNSGGTGQYSRDDEARNLAMDHAGHLPRLRPGKRLL